MIIPSPYANYPSAWATWNRLAGPNDPRIFGLAGTTGDVNRFGARYRLAKAFRGLELDGYTAPTREGYAALCRVFFAWSAFELFLDVIGVDQSNVAGLLKKYDVPAFLKKIRAADTDDRFYKFIYDRVNKTHQAELANYFKDDPCNLTYLTSAIRHIFAHGTLSPNAGQTLPDAVAEVCKLLSSALLKVMDDEFSRILAPYK